MFPMQITLTITNADQLHALAAASGDVKIIESPAGKSPASVKTDKADTSKKPDAATATADTKSTAVAADVQEKKAETSAAKVMSQDERASLIKSKIASAGRDAVVGLLNDYGVKKASEIADAEKLAEFDVKLKALA